MSARESVWIRSALFDGAWILAPPFVISLVVACCPGIFRHSGGGEIPLWGWVVFVLLIDVAHVYGTLFKTYFDRNAREKQSASLIAIPLACWLGGIALYSWSPAVFWRGLAYIAVFHFVRQQYGFVRIYSRHEQLSRFERVLAAATVYAATLYPLIYWHTHLPRAFSWFTDTDFLALPAWLDPLARAVYVFIIASYIGNEWRCRRRPFNWARNVLIAGTALSWFLGIVVYNSDFSFTATNVVAHGLPYMALTWISWEKPPVIVRQRWIFGLGIFAFTLVGLAFAEEWLWDGLVWSERPVIFGSWLSAVNDSATLTWLVPLLALPQSTHYVLDGFIWKRARWYGMKVRSRANPAQLPNAARFRSARRERTFGIQAAVDHGTF